MEKSKDGKRGIPTASRLLSDGRIVDLVYSENNKGTMLAVYDGSKSVLVDELDTDTAERLVPISATNNLIKHRAVLLSEEPEPFESISELIEAIREYMYRYVDLSEQFQRIASYYVLLTWVYDAFNELPYLRLRGDFGSGKTRALMVIGSICYKAFFASGASTVSPIFHTLDTFRGTLILDEADFRFSDEKSELIKILNNGNARGFPVLRTSVTVNREFNPQAFNVFGPKIVAMRRSFEDQALESRFLTEEMGQRSLRSDIPINLPDAQQDEASALRNKLLMYRFRYFQSIRIDDTLVDPTLSPRLNQVLVPLLSIIDDEKLRQEIRAAAHSFDQAIYSERSASSEAGVLEVLSELLADEGRTTVPVSEVTSLFVAQFGLEYDRPITNRYIGGIIRKRLHISTYKSHGIYVVPVSERQKIAELGIRYGVADRNEKLA